MKMNEDYLYSEDYLFSSENTSDITREVITAVNNLNDARPSNRAILGFAVRIAGSWRSIDTIIKHNTDEYEYRAVTCDCEALQRCMYDAYIQMRWIAEGPNDPDEMGQLYLDFDPVEQYKLIECKLKLNDAASKRLANSPRKVKGHARLKARYDAVKHKYPKPNGNGVRNQWYEGRLDRLADEINLTSEYSWMVRKNNSSIHTGASAIFRNAGLDPDVIDHFTIAMLMFCLKFLAEHFGLSLREYTTTVLDAYTQKPLMGIGGE